MTLHEYLCSLLKHGYGESWLPDLTLEQIAAIAAIANQELFARIGGTP